MAINTQLPLGVQPMQIENPVNQLAKVLQIKDMQQSGQMNALKMQEYQRGLSETNTLNEAYRGALGADGTVDRTRLYSTMAERNLGSKIPDIQKKFLDTDKARHDAYKAAGENYKTFQMEIGSEFNNPNLSKQSVAQRIAMRVQAGAMDAALGQRMIERLSDDPQQLRGDLQRLVASQMTPEQLFTAFAPKPEKIDNGQQLSFRDTNPNSPTYGQATAGGVVQKVADPGAVLSAQTSEANNRRSVVAQYANADATRSIAQATRDAANIQRGFESEQGLRKEFEALPEVKKYKQALPSYKGIEDAVKRNTTQADINIVYGIAKLYDPDSVVREGEYATVANSPNIPERIKGYAQYLAGGGKLTAQVKAEILDEAKSRMRSYENEFVGARSNFEQIARRTNVDPTRVFPSPVSPAVPPSSPATPGKPTKPSVSNW
jgi:hypothetical protein